MILEHLQQENHCTSTACNYKFNTLYFAQVKNTCTNLWLLHVLQKGWGYILIYYWLVSKEQMPMYGISEAAPSRFLSGQTKQSIHWHDHTCTSRFLHAMHVRTHTQITVPLDRQGTHYQSQGQDKQKQDVSTPLSYTCVKHGGNTFSLHYFICIIFVHPCYNTAFSYLYSSNASIIDE